MVGGEVEGFERCKAAKRGGNRPTEALVVEVDRCDSSLRARDLHLGPARIHPLPLPDGLPVTCHVQRVGRDGRLQQKQHLSVLCQTRCGVAHCLALRKRKRTQESVHICAYPSTNFNCSVFLGLASTAMC